MFVILAYDVGDEARGERVRNAVPRYLRPVQRSVFEGWLTEGKLKALKRELRGKIDPAADAVVLYRETFTGLQKESIGAVAPDDATLL